MLVTINKEICCETFFSKNIGNKLKILLLFVKLYAIIDSIKRSSERSFIVLRGFITWGCRVSTGGQVEELQVEVSVRTLVKQPTNISCQKYKGNTTTRPRCLKSSDATPPRFFLAGPGPGANNTRCSNADRLLSVS